MSIKITGRIEADGTWKIKARLYYNDKTYPYEIEFLIDSGAETTLITDKEARRADREFGYYSLKTKEVEIGGAGSCMGRPILKAGIVFSEDGKMKDPELCRTIYVPDPKAYRTGANLIGRDILGLYNVYTNIKLRKIVLKRIQTSYMFGDE